MTQAELLNKISERLEAILPTATDAVERLTLINELKSLKTFIADAISNETTPLYLIVVLADGSMMRTSDEDLVIEALEAELYTVFKYDDGDCLEITLNSAGELVEGEGLDGYTGEE